MRLLHGDPRVLLYHGDSLQEVPGKVDCIVTDPPYSERCHDGHRDGVAISGGTYERHGQSADLKCERRDISYPFWSAVNVDRACAVWSRACEGWIVVLTDHVLALIWSAGLDAHGRYVFAPIPFLSPGSRVRLAGDGPSSWTCWIVVARPRHEPYSKWGTLPGGYVFPPERCELVGGKPLSLMKALVSDYSRPGDLVCDPCCGAGTTLRAALDCGRRAVGIDINPEHCEMARKRVAQGVLPLEVAP